MDFNCASCSCSLLSKLFGPQLQSFIQIVRGAAVVFLWNEIEVKWPSWPWLLASGPSGLLTSSFASRNPKSKKLIFWKSEKPMKLWTFCQQRISGSSFCFWDIAMRIFCDKQLAAAAGIVYSRLIQIVRAAAAVFYSNCASRWTFYNSKLAPAIGQLVAK